MHLAAYHYDQAISCHYSDLYLESLQAITKLLLEQAGIRLNIVNNASGETVLDLVNDSWLYWSRHNNVITKLWKQAKNSRSSQ